MLKREKKEIINIYETRLRKYGDSVRTMGWRDKEQQCLRFKILAEIGDLNGTRILDVGCGFGDFYEFLIKRSIKVDYTGYDISHRIIEVAKSKHPEIKSKFKVKDILRERTNERFDYVMESGILNRRISDNIKYAKKIIARMFELCKIGVAVNMMTNYVDYKEDSLYYYSPEEMFKFCKSLTKGVVLRHDYPLYEFTLYLYKKSFYIYKRYQGGSMKA